MFRDSYFNLNFNSLIKRANSEVWDHATNQRSLTRQVADRMAQPVGLHYTQIWMGKYLINNKQ